MPNVYIVTKDFTRKLTMEDVVTTSYIDTMVPTAEGGHVLKTFKIFYRDGRLVALDPCEKLDGHFIDLAVAYMDAGLERRPERAHVAEGRAPASSIELATQMMHSQREKGLAKYGVSIEDAKLSPEELIQHAREEAADLSVYLSQLSESLVEIGYCVEGGQMLTDADASAWRAIGYPIYRVYRSKEVVK